MINIIAAIGKNRELGKDNKLIWHLAGDLKFFKETTTGKCVVMGRKTYESIGKPLPNRENIVLTSHQIDGVTGYSSIDEILDLNKEVFIIGGASIYKEFINYADNIYLTEINSSFDADVFFPKFDKTLYSREILGQMSENGLEYSFILYKKKRK